MTNCCVIELAPWTPLPRRFETNARAMPCEVHADVGVKGAIFQRDGRIAHQLRDLVDREIGAVAAERPRVDGLVEQVLAGPVVDLDRLVGGLLGLDGAGVGQVLGEKGVDACD